MKQRVLICLIFATGTLVALVARKSAFFPVLPAHGPTISTVAGSDTAGYWVTVALPPGPSLNFPIGVAVDGNNNLFIADTFNYRIRQFKLPGIITTVAGNGAGGFCDDNRTATSGCLYVPEAVAVDDNGNLLIADTFNHRICKVNASGTITTVAGNGTADFCGDNGPGTSACLNFPQGVAADDAG